MTATEDMQEFIARLKSTRDVVVVDDTVSWDREAPAIARRLCEMNGPAIWFRRIRDYDGAGSLFFNPLATWRRLALALGLPADTSIPELYRVYEERQLQTRAPVIVSDALCQEIYHPRDRVNLFDIPAPMLHDGDGGRYIGTWDLVVSKDPQTGWSNWGMYRFMIHNRHLLTGFPRPTSHFGKTLLECYVAQGQCMPVAIVVGADVLSHAAAAATYGLAQDEAALAGGLRQKPVPLVRCMTQDLWVPANAELVIEGEVLPDRIAPEGPYGEYPGYRTGEMGHGITVAVTTITHRNKPILTVDATGYKDDSSVVTAISGAISAKNRLKRHGIPVRDVYIPAEGAVHVAVISVDEGGPEVTQSIVDILTSRRALLSKIFVVDTDVNVFDWGEVMHAFATKCHPVMGIHQVQYQGRANTLTPCYSQSERQDRRGATVGFDCTWPPLWNKIHEVPVKATFHDSFAPDIRQQVLERWDQLVGYAVRKGEVEL